MTGRAEDLWGAANPGLPPGATVRRPPAADFPNDVDGWIALSRDCRIQALIAGLSCSRDDGVIVVFNVCAFAWDRDGSVARLRRTFQT